MMNKVLFGAFLIISWICNPLHTADKTGLPTAEEIIKGNLRTKRAGYHLPSFLIDKQPVQNPLPFDCQSNDVITPNEEESADSLEPVRVKAVTLKNFTGNSCFANAVTQAILSSPPVLNYIEAIKGNALTGAAKLLCEVVSNFRKADLFSSLDTNSFVWGSLQAFFPHQPRSQHDAGEFAVHLFDSLPQTFPAGVYSTTVRCATCGRESNRQEVTRIYEIPYNDPVNEIRTIEEALTIEQRVETLEGDTAYACDFCKKKQEAYKQTLISPHDELIIIRLKRECSSHAWGSLDKCTTPIKVGRTINVNGLSYSLTGAVLHRGLFGFGHYIALIRAPFLHRETSRWTSSPFWYTANDTAIDSPLAGEEMLKAIMAGERPAGFDVVMLFYAKESGLPETFGSLEKPEPTGWSCTIQ